MATSPFAALEHRVNTAALKHAANSVVVFSGSMVPAIFDRPSAMAFGGLAEASQPQLLCASQDLDCLSNGAPIVVRRPGAADQLFIVASTQPDGTGFTRILLETP